MKNKISAIVAICVVIVCFAACKEPSSKLALYVPADASVVFTFNVKTLTGKIASSGVSIDSLTRILNNPMEENHLGWNDIQNAGIYLDKPVYAFFKELNTMQEGSIKSNALMAEVEDEKKLTAFFQKNKPGKNIVPAGEYKYIALGEDYVAGWTKDVFIMSQVSGGNNAPGNYGTGEGTLSQQLLTTLFTQKKSASIADAPGFEDMLAKPGDIHFYATNNTGLAAEKLPGGTALLSLLKDSYTEGTINFEKGKITASPVTHYGKTLADMLSKYPPKQINKEMLRNYPDTLTGFILASFNPHIITDVLRHSGFDNMIDGFASNLGFTSQDFVNVFSGDIGFMFSLNTSAVGQLGTSHNVSYLLNFKIADRALFDKVLNGLLNKQILTKDGDQYRIGMTGGHGFIIETGKNSLLIASSDELIKAYESGVSKANMPEDIEKQVSDKSMAFYIDINNLLGNNRSDTATGPGKKQDTVYTFGIPGLAKETFKDIIATVDKSDGKTAKADVALNFVNTNENSLAVIAKFLSIMKAEQLKREAYRHEMIPGNDREEETEND